MPKYTFTGPDPRVFTGLRVGHGVTVRRRARPDPQTGETVQLDPGDTITSRDPITHPELVAAPVRTLRMPATPTAPDDSGAPSTTTPEE
jgi:hypothetical protein